MVTNSPVEHILDLARWAPSGDNSQPWRIEVTGPKHFTVHGHDTRDHCVYDLDGHASQLALGALVETAAIAASLHGLAVDAVLRRGTPENQPTIDVSLKPDQTLTPSALVSSIAERSVQRRPLSRRPIDKLVFDSLREAVGPDHELVVFQGLGERAAWARLLWRNAGLRLRLPEAFQTHSSIIQWRARFSADRVPDQALGASSLTLLLMRHALKSWGRVHFFNTWLGGTLAPRIEMDLLPAMLCGAHVAILAAHVPTTIADHIAAGRAVQRFWLSATSLRLQHQPAFTPLVFSRYAREQREFTCIPRLAKEASRIGEVLNERLLGRADRAVWLGRLGYGPSASARSVRRELSELMGRPGP